MKRSGYLAWAAKGACDEGTWRAPKKQAGPAAVALARDRGRDRNAIKAQKNHPVEIHAFELHPATAQLLSHLINVSGAAGLVRVLNMPVSDASTPVRRPRLPHSAVEAPKKRRPNRPHCPHLFPTYPRLRGGRRHLRCACIRCPSLGRRWGDRQARRAARSARRASGPSTSTPQASTTI